MNLTPKEIDIILVSLNHIEEHLFIAYEAGDITLDTFNLKINTCKSIKTKIK